MENNSRIGYIKLKFMRLFKKKFLYESWDIVVTNTMSIISALLENLHRHNNGELEFSDMASLVNDYLSAVAVWRKHPLFHPHLELAIDNLMVQYIDTIVDYAKIDEIGSQLDTYRKMFTALSLMKEKVNEGYTADEIDFDNIAERAIHEASVNQQLLQTAEVVQNLMKAEVERGKLYRNMMANISQVHGYLLSDFLELCEGVDVVAERRKKSKVKGKQALTIKYIKADPSKIGKISEESD